MVGEIWLWKGTAADMAIASKARAGDDRGTTNIGLDDIRWGAEAQVEGLLVGLPGFGLVHRLASPAGSACEWKTLSRWVAA